MVSYFNAGTQWATAAGNPKKVDPAKPCGITVGRAEGARCSRRKTCPPKQKACQTAGKPLKVLVYTAQDQATAAVVSGKADAMLADSPVVAYAVKKSIGQARRRSVTSTTPRPTATSCPRPTPTSPTPSWRP